MSTRHKLVAGNWKMNTTRDAAVALARAVAAEAPGANGNVEVLVAPPFPYLIPVADALSGSGVLLGAQNSCAEPPGAFTGEVANAMLRDVGCTHVILGHSERRHVFRETDADINRKVKAALAAGLTVIFCVGELLEERDAGRTDAVLDQQMAGGLADVATDSLAQLVVAYEPVWAIGTGKTATPEQAEAAHVHLRNWLNDHYSYDVAARTLILYGGSVKQDNAETLLRQPNIDGALVGGASLKAEQFLPIVRAALQSTDA